MEPIAIGFCVFESIWLLLCAYIIRRTYQRQVYNYQRYERNLKEYVEDILTKQRVESGVSRDDLLLKELHTDNQEAPITIQLRILILRNLSKYSLASFTCLHLIHKYQSLLKQFLDLNLVVTLCPFIAYSLLGEVLQNIAMFSLSAVGVGLCIFAALNCAYRHQPQFQIQNSIQKLYNNLNRYSALTVPTKIERSLENEFVLEVSNQTEQLSLSLSTSLNWRRKSLSLIVASTVLTAVVMYSYVGVVTTSQVFYGILYGVCIQQIELTILGLLWSFYEYQRPDPTIAQDLKHLIQSKPQSLVNSPARKQQNIKDRDSPLKYLIKKEQMEGPMSKTANKSHQTSMDKKIDQSYEMNSGDNLIPQQQQQELNDFVIDEPKEQERPTSVKDGTPNKNYQSPKAIGNGNGTTPEYSMKKVFSQRTQLQPLGESSSKKNVISAYGKLPPVRRKENVVPEFQIEKSVIEENQELHHNIVQEEKIEELAEVDKQSLQRSIPLQDVENTQFSIRHKMEVRQSQTRNSLYKTSMEMEEESFQQTRLNIKSISSSQRYEEDFPQNQTIQLSNFGMVGMMTMDPIQQQQDTKRERGRSETMHVKQKRPKKQESQSVDDPSKEQENASSDLSKRVPPPPKRKNVKKLQQIAKIYDTTKIQISSKQRFD